MEGKKIIIAHNWKETSFNTQSVKLAEALSEKNEVVFISQMRLPSSLIKINENLTVVQWPNKKPNGIKDLIFCYNLFKQFKPDITVSHFTAQNIISFMGKILGVKHRLSWYHTLLEQIKIDFKGSNFQFYIQTVRKKIILHLATNILLVSKYSQKEVSENYKVDINKLKVINNGIVDHQFRNNTTNNKYFIFLGRYDECKGIDILLHAAAIVKKQIPDICFFLAGGKTPPLSTKLIHQLDIEDNIKNVGFIKYDEVFKYLCTGYALIVPSRIDNLPTVVLEAFSCGTPVIGSFSGGIPEMIEDGIDGLLFEKENSNDLAEKIIALSNNQQKRSSMSIAARNKFENNFTIPNYVSNVTSFLNTLN